jgi:hypothetical protein
MASALRSFSSARHSALARGGIAASTEHPAGAAIQAQNLPTICVCGLLLFCFTLLYFCLFRRPQPVRPGEKPPECRDYVTQPIPYSHGMSHGNKERKITARRVQFTIHFRVNTGGRPPAATTTPKNTFAAPCNLHLEHLCSVIPECRPGPWPLGLGLHVELGVQDIFLGIHVVVSRERCSQELDVLCDQKTWGMHSLCMYCTV